MDHLAAQNRLLLGKLEVLLWEVDRMKLLQKDTFRALARIADDQFELRTGIPPEWRKRVVLVAVAAAIGALTGSAVTVAAQSDFLAGVVPR